MKDNGFNLDVILENNASWFGCSYDKKLEELYVLSDEKNLESDVLKLIQAFTAICSIINYERHLK